MMLTTGTEKGAGAAKAEARPVTWSMVFGTAVLSFLAVGYYNTVHEEKTKATSSQVSTVGEANLGGDWRLLDTSTGKFFSNKDLEGIRHVLYFGFTNCPDICPSELKKLSKVLALVNKDAVQEKDKVLGIFVSVDPERDSVDNMVHYSKNFHPDIKYLTGTPSMLKKMAKLYRVYISKAEEIDGDYLVDHSVVLYYVGADGKFKDFFTQAMRAQDIVKRMK